MRGMNRWMGWIVGLALLAFSAGRGAGEQAMESPVITAIQMAGEEVVVQVYVPAGVRKVTLEGRLRIGEGNWVPRAVWRPPEGGTATEITFRVQAAGQLELLRVRADAEDVLPASFFEGESEFGGAASYYDNGPADNRFNMPPEAGLPDDAAGGGETREVVESDIWKIDGDRLYFFNQYRGLQVLDISDADAPKLLGTLALPAAGEQMYVLGEDHVVLLAYDRCNRYETQSQVMVVDVADGVPEVEQVLPVPGTIMESRLVGTALYVASQVYRQTENEADPDATGGVVALPRVVWEYGVKVAAFDLALPEQPVARNTLWYPGYNNTVTATDQFLFVAMASGSWREPSVIQCIDISSPDGTMFEKGTVRPSGRVADKFKMRLSGEVFSVVSELQTGFDQITWVTRLENFSLANPDRPVLIGSLGLGRGERLFATRFDADRVYIVTFLRIDPLWVVDNSDPENPAISGELEIPGWSNFIFPLGDRLVTVGIDNLNGWRAAVQLFDVADPKNPVLLSKVPLGDENSWSEANYDEKAFTVLEAAGMILVPYQGYESGGYASRVQIIDLEDDALVERGVIEHSMQPRRATLVGDRVLSISAREFLVVDATDRDTPVVTAELELSWPVNDVLVYGDFLVELETVGYGWGQPRRAAIRATSAEAPDEILGRWELESGWSLLGAEIRGDMLYVLEGQSEGGIYYWGVPEADAGGEENPDPDAEPEPNMGLIVFDLGRLPELEPTATTRLVSEEPLWSRSMQALWPRDGLLVWSSEAGYYYWRGWGPEVLDVGIAASPDFWWPGWGGGSGRLLAFRVDGEVPELASDLNLSAVRERGWSFSAAHAAEGLVYLSHEESVFVPNETIPGIKPPPLPPETGDKSSDAEVVEPTPGIYVQRFALDVVDYTDPEHPVVRPPADIPGRLIGISHHGALLYTQGTHWDEEYRSDGREWIDAAAYDGVEVHRVDALELPMQWPHPVYLTDGRLYLGRPAVSSDTNGETVSPPMVEFWELSDEGAFGRIGRWEIPSAASDLRQIRDLFAAQANQELHMFQVEESGALIPIKAGPQNFCFWFDLEHADGSLSGGLWLPLGDYGITHLPTETE